VHGLGGTQPQPDCFVWNQNSIVSKTKVFETAALIDKLVDVKIGQTRANILSVPTTIGGVDLGLLIIAIGSRRMAPGEPILMRGAKF
jgi:hypothetical protein